MYGFKSQIDLTWTGSHAIMVEWELNSLVIHFSQGKFNYIRDPGICVYPYTASFSPTIQVSPREPGYIYLGVSQRASQIDNTVWYTPYASTRYILNDGTIGDSWRNMGYEYGLNADNDSGDQTTIAMKFFILDGGNRARVTCSYLSIDFDIYPDVNYDRWTHWLAPTQTQGIVGNKVAYGSLPNTCILRIANQAVHSQNGYSPSPQADYYYEKFANIDSIQVGGLENDSDVVGSTYFDSFLTTINATHSWPYTGVPGIRKPGYWYYDLPLDPSIPRPATLEDGIVATTEGAIDPATAYSKTINLFPQYGAGFAKLPDGSEVVSRHVSALPDGSAQPFNHFRRAIETDAWIHIGSATPETKQMPLDWATDATAKARWDQYGFGKPNGEYVNNQRGRYPIGNCLDNRCCFKQCGANETIFQKNYWDYSATFRSVSNYDYSPTNYDDYNDKFPQAFKQLYGWQDPPWGTGFVRYWSPQCQDIVIKSPQMLLGGISYIYDTEPRISFYNYKNELKKVVALAASASSDDLTWPWLILDADGNWLAEFFYQNTFYSYRSSDVLGTSWALETTYAVAFESRLINIQKLRLRNGNFIILGCFDDSANVKNTDVLLYYRTGLKEEFQGPYLNLNLDYPVCPYITELSDGKVELGYYDQGGWHQWETDDVKQNVADWEVIV